MSKKKISWKMKGLQWLYNYDEINIENECEK
jgi:hypothetical protein